MSCSWSYGKCFQLFTIELMLSLGFSYMAFIMLRKVSPSPFLESFYHKWMWNVVKSSFCIYSQWFFFLSWDKVAWWSCTGFCYTMKWISYMYRYIPSLVDHPPKSLYPTDLGYDRLLSWAPFSIAVHSSYLFHWWYCMSIPVFQFNPPSFPASCPNIHCLGLHCYSCLGNKFICTIKKKKNPYTCEYIFVLFFLSYFTMYGRL